MNPGSHGSTFGGNPNACAVGIEVMKQIFKPRFLNNVKKMSDHLFLGLYNLKSNYPKVIKEIRGKGLLIGIQLNVNQTEFIKSLERNNLLTIRAAENVVRILPPLNVKKKRNRPSSKNYR